MAITALTVLLLVSAFRPAAATDTFCASCAEVGFCFEPRLCPHFSEGLWQHPHAACNAAVYSRGKAACVSCFPAWNCSGVSSSPTAPAHTPSPAFEAAAPTVGPSPTPSPPTFCESCWGLRNCFGPRVCPYMSQGLWQPPYHDCNILVYADGKAACQSCFPEFTCMSYEGSGVPPPPSPPAPSPPAPSPSAPPPAPSPSPSSHDIQNATDARDLECPPHCSRADDRCFEELACVDFFDGVWHGPHTHCNTFKDCRDCYPDTSCTPPRDFAHIAFKRELDEGDRGALEALAAAGAITEATCSSPEVTCRTAALTLRVHTLNVRPTNGTAGQLSWLEPLTALQMLAVPLSFSGSLASLQGLQQLMTLRLRGPGIHGALDALQACGGLRHLSLTNMRLQGSLYDLMPLRALEVSPTLENPDADRAVVIVGAIQRGPG